MDNIEKTLLKELSRFKEIGYNIENLEEQVVSGMGNLGMGSHVERLAKRFNIELGEQEDPEALPLDPDAEMEDMGGEEDLPLDPDAEMEDMEGGDEETDIDMDVDIDTQTDTEAEDTTELDVTDLVTKQDETNTELSDQKDILSKNTESLDDLMTKLADLETHLSSMDDMVNKISNLEDKIEEYRPRTPEEQIGLRKYDSGPYNKTLSDFFNDKEDVFDKTGKKQYILTPDEVENYNEDDIRKSFDNQNED